MASDPDPAPPPYPPGASGPRVFMANVTIRRPGWLERAAMTIIAGALIIVAVVVLLPVMLLLLIGVTVYFVATIAATAVRGAVAARTGPEVHRRNVRVRGPDNGP